MADTNIDKIIEAARTIELWKGSAGTGAVMSIFEKLGRDLNYEVAYRWLYDMVWYTEEQGEKDKFLTGLPMVLESELNKRHPDLDGDFQKLIQARADVRVWISACSDARLHIDACKQQIKMFPGTLSGDQYVFAIYDQKSRKSLIEKYLAP
jgi:hypothetical protein